MDLLAASRLEALAQDNARLTAQVASLQEDCAVLKRQLEWCKRQLFGRTSEKRVDIEPAEQGNLLLALGMMAPPQAARPIETIRYQRRKKACDAAVTECGLRFSEDVPREVIRLKDPQIEALPEARRELIGTNVTYHLAQRPDSYVIIEYHRQVYKLRDEQTIMTAPAPANVLEKSVANALASGAFYCSIDLLIAPQFPGLRLPIQPTRRQRVLKQST